MGTKFTDFQMQLKTNPHAILLVNINVDHEIITAARQAGLYVYIGKTSKWGNPYQVGWDGAQQEIIAKYRSWLNNRPKLLAQLPSLRGKVLGCYCAPRPCHGDVLIELATQGESV
jgi:hypothetical protein